MRQLLKWFGIAWMALAIAYGVWLGVTGLLFDAPGILFQSGFGDIWILALAALPGYGLYVWGTK